LDFYFIICWLCVFAMTIENIIAVVSLLGIGGLISAYFTLLWQR